MYKVEQEYPILNLIKNNNNLNIKSSYENTITSEKIGLESLLIFTNFNFNPYKYEK